jgi:hypothetical protein
LEKQAESFGGEIINHDILLEFIEKHEIKIKVFHPIIIFKVKYDNFPVELLIYLKTVCFHNIQFFNFFFVFFLIDLLTEIKRVAFCALNNRISDRKMMVGQKLEYQEIISPESENAK